MQHFNSLGTALIVRSLKNLILTIAWEEELPQERQIDITVFLLELFRHPGDPELQEYHRVSLHANYLYCFTVHSTTPTSFQIDIGVDPEGGPFIEPH